MNWNNGLVAPDIPGNVAQINRDLSGYIWQEVPTREIDQTCVWLRGVICDCETKIYQLQKIKTERERVKKWRDNIKTISRQFYEENTDHIDLHTRTEIVRQRLGCSYAQAKEIAVNVEKWVKAEKKKNRNSEIKSDHASGMSVAGISRKYKISRQHVYNVLRI